MLDSKDFFGRANRGERRDAPPPDYTRGVARSVSSQALFQGDREIGIEHAGSLYRLKITRQGKLILNK